MELTNEEDITLKYLVRTKEWKVFEKVLNRYFEQVDDLKEFHAWWHKFIVYLGYKTFDESK